MMKVFPSRSQEHHRAPTVFVSSASMNTKRPNFWTVSGLTANVGSGVVKAF